MKAATGGNCFPVSPSCQTVIHHSYPNITGCVEGCPYPFSRQSALATMGFRVYCCSTRDAAAMAEENPDLPVHWPLRTKCCRGSVPCFQLCFRFWVSTHLESLGLVYQMTPLQFCDLAGLLSCEMRWPFRTLPKLSFPIPPVSLHKADRFKKGFLLK